MRILLGLCAAFALLLSLPAQAKTPPGVTLKSDIAYGADKAQRFDVYLPPKPEHAPILIMAHGGGWRIGDKENGRVIDNKVEHFVPKGVIFVSVNYRMLPDAKPIVQAEDLARAVAKVQELAPGWGGDADNIVLMGHSAGAHLAGLITAAPEIGRAQNARPWKGAVLLDSAAIDVPRIMQARHLRLYDRAFGDNPTEWQSVSPLHRLNARIVPTLAVCSSRRAESCPANQAFAAKARGLGGSADVMPLDLSHAEINMQLGQPGAYTDRVDAFLRGLGWKT